MSISLPVPPPAPSTPDPDRELSPDYDSTIEFLKNLHSGRRWVLTAINPDIGKPITSTFDNLRIAECRRWLEQNGELSNLYFAVSPPGFDTGKKTCKTEIDEVWVLHCDVDPRDEYPIEDERKRILSMLKTKQDGVPLPTAIIDSGSGFQGFWMLQHSIAVNRSEVGAEAAEQYNRFIQRAYSADSCHDVTRIMRLPGTINRPNATKIAKGRTEALATVVELNLDHIYSIESFKKLGKGVPDKCRDVHTNFIKCPPIKSIADLPVPLRIKTIIQHGHFPGDPREGDRSVWIFETLIGLIRAGVHDGIIFSIITDPRFKISERILERPDADAFAKAEIQRAHDKVPVDDDICLMNKQYAFIREFGGKPVVVWDVDTSIEGDRRTAGIVRRRTLTKMSPNQFASAHRDQLHKYTDDDGKPKSVPLADYWMKHPNARRFDRVQLRRSKSYRAA